MKYDKIKLLLDLAFLFKRFFYILQALQDDAETCERKMLAAEALIGGLQEEKERWTEESKGFLSQINK